MRFSILRVFIASVFVICFSNSLIASVVTLSDSDFATGNSIDSWNSNMVIQESYNYTNTSGGNELVCVQSWAFDAGADRGRVTPFLVTLNDTNSTPGDLYDDNNFTVEWTGNTLVSDNAAGGTGLGDWGASDVNTTVTFVESGCFTISDGETIAIGFLNSNPDGTGTGIPGSVITWDSSVPAGEMWYNGRSDAIPASYVNGVLTDLTLSGAPAANVQNRSYNFGLTLEIASVPEPSHALVLLLGACWVGTIRKR